VQPGCVRIRQWLVVVAASWAYTTRGNALIVMVALQRKRHVARIIAETSQAAAAPARA